MTVREPGYCALYGDCGKVSPFGDPLPCPNNTLARPLPKTAAKHLKDLCGPEFAGDVCCTAGQVAQLEKNLKRAAPIIQSCPACRDNFFQLFCRFTCSPDQSQFIEVLETRKSLDDRDAVAELNYYVDPALAAGLYNSCAEVKFSATNGRAMDLIGGGARDYPAFFKFMGDEKPSLGGSPFQINFPWPEEASDATLKPAELPPGIIRSNASVYGCADKGDFHCSCVDCPAACPELDRLRPPNSCEFGGLSCASWGLLVGYLVCLLVAFAAWVHFKGRGRRSKTVPMAAGAASEGMSPSTGLGTAQSYEIQRLIDDDEDDDINGGGPGDVRDIGPNDGYYAQIYAVNRFLQSYLTKLAYFCAKFPLSVITLCVLLSAVSSLGLFWVEILDQPDELWVGPNSQVAQEKAYFDEHFGRFYRTAQMFAVNDTGPILQEYSTLEWWFDVEQRVATTRSPILQDALDSFCLKPIGDHCVIQSAPQYFGGDIKRLPEATWKQKLETCARSPVRCLPPFQQPIAANLVFGPYNQSILETPALVSTWVLVNDDTPAFATRVQHWELEIERLFTEVVEEAKERGLRVSFRLESSLDRELQRSSRGDIKIVVISYLLMFIYASLALGGRIRSGQKVLVQSKFTLGLFGIFVVCLSVASSIGICAMLGIKMTLIITEVIPFLVLAVGVDNIFLLVHYLGVVNDLYSQYSIEERISEAVGLIGPSILLSSSCEVVAIALGASVAMPAVHNFAIYSALAVAINTALQLTMFVAAMTLDQKRVQQGRADCVPCLVVAELDSEDEGTPDPFESQEDPRRFSALIAGDLAPHLFRRKVKLGVVSIFMLWLAVSLTIIPRMEMGLDQRLAVPADSFLVDYFSDVYDYFEAGPPVYFVVKDVDVEHREEQQNLCGRFSTCDEYSLVNVLEQERKRPEISFIDAPTASWIDDFFEWLNPDLDMCCLEDKQGGRCAHPGKDCSVCYSKKPYSFNMTGLPEGTNFTHYMTLWLDAPSGDCPLAGKAPYGNALSRRAHHQVVASQFRTSHTPLRSQADYINAYESARRIADDLSGRHGLDVFPYSVFYVFFDQYRTIVQDALGLLGTALGVLFLISAVLLGSPMTAFIVTGVVAVMLCNIAGLMVFFGVPLNALSLVNLVICVGIGVEFCVHIARSFTYVHKVNSLGVQGMSRTERAFNALAGTGGTVFGGIALTKLIGVVVLAFAQSKIFEVFYFRMWLALVFCATLHSLALLPVLLAYFGGKFYLLENAGLIDQFGELSL